MRVKDTTSFIEKSMDVHKGEYSYDDTVYIDSNTDVIITCRLHGNFKQKPKNHLNGKGCPICGEEKRRKKLSLGMEGFLIDFARSPLLQVGVVHQVKNT